ncbi:MAG: ATP-binding protein [Oscillospiraceae bacterium]|jgi:DNA replication protein DnaC|nr:ATP-binding protein [Oscillospiraceae bacterium]
MNLNTKYYSKAGEEIKRRSEVNSEKLNFRRREVEDKIPQYKIIRQKMAGTGAKIYDIIYSGDNETARVEKLERLTKENLNAQETIKVLLVNNGFEPDYLAEVYTCKKCCDTGVYQNRRCSCFKEIAKRLAAEELNAASPIKLCDFDSFDLNFYTENIKDRMTRNLNYCKSYAEDFHLPCEGIFMQGATGLGKTHLSLAIAKTVITKGYSVIYGSSQKLIGAIVKENFGRESEVDSEELLNKADLLIIDDLGTEVDNRYYVSALYNLLNSRISAGLPTVINTNCEVSQLKKQYGDAVVSRILMTECLPFFGEDIRISRKHGGSR